MPVEYIDFLLCTEIYHCTPSELDAQDHETVQMHIAFINMKREKERIDQKRQEQAAKYPRK